MVKRWTHLRCEKCGLELKIDASRIQIVKREPTDYEAPVLIRGEPAMCPGHGAMNYWLWPVEKGAEHGIHSETVPPADP